MRQVTKEQGLGSSPGDMEYMAEYINVARTHLMKVWSNAKADSACCGGNVAPMSMTICRFCEKR